MHWIEPIALIAAAPPTPSASDVSVTSVWDFLLKGGIMMVPIGVCSLIVLAVTVERLVVLSRRRVAPEGFGDALREELKRGAPRDHAVDYCKRDGSPLARIAQAGVEQMGRPIGAIEKHMASAGEHEVYDLRKRLRVLSVITAAAPLLGLVGTIFGMIKAFQTVALSGEALGKTELLAKGIYEAMITTAAGLLVAIPSLIVYHIIAGRIERLVREIDREAVDLAERIAEAGGAEFVEPRVDGGATTGSVRAASDIESGTAPAVTA